MKYNINKIFALLFASTLAFVSCEQVEPDYAVNTDAKPIVSFSQASYSVDEGTDLEITLNSNYPYYEDMHFQLDILTDNSSATEFDDFELSLDHTTIEWGTENSYRIDFPKHQSSFTFSLSAFLDEFVEDNETVMLRITPKGNFNGDFAESNTVEIVINQKGAEVVEFTFDWNKDFDFNGSTYSLCQIGYDMDFLIADGAGNLLDYIAGTADCPEVGEININDLNVGDTYRIYLAVYDDQGLSGVGISPAFSIPVTVNFSRYGSNLNGSFIQDAANAVDSNFGSPDLANPVYVGSLSVDSNGIVTLFDETTSSTIATGKMSTLPSLKGFDKLPKRIK